MKLNSLQECEQALAAFIPPPRSLRKNYSLQNVKLFMNAVGNPQNNYQVVHVAGTSGKTSTCYYVSALFKEAGLKTGLTVSPHITNVTERAQINLVPAVEADFCEALGEFLDLVYKVAVPLTYFEVLVVFAYWYFAKVKVDVAVIETGIGGLLDGSNIVDNPSKVCVLTDIGFDHTALLGNTISKIAAQKAGIIGQSNEVFSWQQSTEIMDVFAEAATKKQAPIHVITSDVPALPTQMPLFQKRNFSLAAEATKWTLKHRFNKTLSESQINSAAEQAIPARMETVHIGEQLVTMDGAHNPQKMAALVESYQAINGTKRPVALFSCIEGPDTKIEQTVREFLKLQPQRVVVTAFKSLQDIKKVSVAPVVLQEYFNKAGYLNTEVINKPVEGLASLLDGQSDVLITGSFYLIFDVRNHVLRA